MSKSRAGKKKKNQAKRPPVADVEFQGRALRSPLDRDAAPKMRRLHDSFLGDPEARYLEVVTRLDTLVRSTDPLRLLTSLNIDHSFFPAGFDAESVLSDALTQWPLEWLQGFCLRANLAEYHLGTVLDSATVREIGASLRWIGATVGAVWFRQREERFGRESSDQIDGSWEQQQSRIATMAVRNWSYRPHMVAIVRQLCERLDGWSVRELGYPLSAVPDLLFHVEEETERRVNRQRRSVRSVTEHSASPIGMCTRWQRSDLPGAERAHELEQDLRQGRLTEREVIAEFYLEIQQSLPAHFTFTLAELESLSGGRLTGVGLARLMANLSYEFGALRETPVLHLTLGNPVWTRPFVALGDGTYFCPHPATGLSHLLDLVRALVVGDDEDAEPAGEESEESRRWSEARSTFLEKRTCEVLAQAFPSAAIYPNSKYDDPPVGVDFENDFAVILGDVVLVIEAKSQRVPAAAWRGAPGGMRRLFKEMVLKAATQSANFANYLFRAKGPRPFWRKGGGEFSIDSSNIRSAVSATVVLDPYPVARNMNPNLRHARLLREGDPEPPPTIQLAALEAILVLLPDELQRIHYLARRQVLQSLCPVHVADEHDLLALYVDTGFNLPELEDSGAFLAFDTPLAKKQVDPYLEEWFAGRVRRQRPERRLQPQWRNWLQKLQTDRPPDWVTIGMALLDASAKQQHEFLERSARAAKIVKSAADPGPVDWWTVDVGLSYWHSRIVGVVAKGLPTEDRASFIIELVDREGLNEEYPCSVLLFDVAVDRKIPVAVLFFQARGVEAPYSEPEGQRCR